MKIFVYWTILYEITVFSQMRFEIGVEVGFVEIGESGVFR